VDASEWTFDHSIEPAVYFIVLTRHQKPLLQNLIHVTLVVHLGVKKNAAIDRNRVGWASLALLLQVWLIFYIHKMTI